jgi:hypothetical protein
MYNKHYHIQMVPTADSLEDLFIITDSNGDPITPTPTEAELLPMEAPFGTAGVWAHGDIAADAFVHLIVEKIYTKAFLWGHDIPCVPLQVDYSEREGAPVTYCLSTLLGRLAREILG